MWDVIVKQFNDTFIKDDMYKLFFDGLKNTLIIALFATILGVVIGVVTAVIKVHCAQTGKNRFLNVLCDIYLTVIRGTPIVVQLLVMYFIVLSSFHLNAIIVAIIAFGINSGAYVAEIVRAGIMAIDTGQTEAGRSLGLSSFKTMRLIILPQAFKNILPALGNEFISLLKETSVVGYITIIDLTRAGNLVRSKTLQPFFSLIAVALMYLVMVMILTNILKRLERRLRKGDRSQESK